MRATMSSSLSAKAGHKKIFKNPFFSKAKAKISDFFGGIGDGITDAYDTTADFVEDTFQGLKSGVNNAVGAVQRATSNASEAVQSAVASARAKIPGLSSNPTSKPDTIEGLLRSKLDYDQSIAVLAKVVTKLRGGR